MRRLGRIEALGFTFVESALPPIVRDWCIGDSVLCLIQGEFGYFDNEAWKKLRPYPIERVLAGYTIFTGLIVINQVR